MKKTITKTEAKLIILNQQISEILNTDWNITDFKDSYSSVSMVECKGALVLAQKRLASIRKKEGFT